MRYVPLQELLKEIFESAEGRKIQRRLSRAQQYADGKEEEECLAYIQRNGSGKWSALKEELIHRWGKKCWYTEVMPLGSDLTIDHYRPKRHYRWMAFAPENFRVACAYSNSQHFNSEHDCNGGKGDLFPLMSGTARATDSEALEFENPIILDPCNPSDCDLLAFQSDGRPVIHPHHAKDAEACLRVEASKLLLNLDHPELNKARETLYHIIRKAVSRHEELPEGSAAKLEIEDELEAMLTIKAQFSVAAWFYLGCYRNKPWVGHLMHKFRPSS